MCGICGIVNLDPSNPVDPALILQMTNSLTHRGPDDDGYFVSGNAGLGHRRLSVIDLEGGHQPIFNEDSSAVIVFNGEIYNHAELARTLVARGHQFKTRSDTEAILHAYEEFGEDCVNHLRGMFAFAIWDLKNRRLFLGRDRLGIKPVYFFQGPQFLAFASEIKALHQIPGIPRQINLQAVDSYLTLRYVPGPETMFARIFKLQPGHTLTLDSGGSRVRKYWDIQYGPVLSQDSSTQLARFEDLLDESVRIRLVSEVPLGVFLSGGLDSSAILAVASRLREGPAIKSFSVGYEVSDSETESENEFAYARMASRALGSEHHEYHLSPAEFRDFIPKLVWYLDEPLADESCIPLFYLSRLARRHITVVLSGEGADEVLAGYSIYKRMLTLDRIYRNGPGLSALVSGLLGGVLHGDKARRYARLLGSPMESTYRGVSMGVSAELKRELLRNTSSANGQNSVDELFRGHFRNAGATSSLNRMLYVDSKVWLPEDILLKADKMTMANGLELRVPFLDHRLVEFASQLPDHHKLSHGSGKVLLRAAMRGVLPEPIINRPKKGFPVPTATWLRGPLRGFAHDMLLSRSSSCRDFVDQKVVERIFAEHESGSVNRVQELWTLLIFEMWNRVFMQKQMEQTEPYVPHRSVPPPDQPQIQDAVGRV